MNRKRIIACVVFLVASVGISFSQQIKLTLEPTLSNDTVYIDVYVQSDAPFELGSSNFPFIALDDALQTSSALITSPTGSITLSELFTSSYQSLGFYTGDFIHVLVLKKFSDTDHGVQIGKEPVLIASIVVPVANKCTSLMLDWIKDRGTITNFEGKDLKSSIEYVQTQPLTLVKELETPSLTFENKTLNVKTTGTVKWYKDGTLLPEATNTIYTPTLPGVYHVEASNGCVSKKSEEIMVDVVAGVADEKSLSESVYSFPSPAQLGETITVKSPHEIEKASVASVTGTSYQEKGILEFIKGSKQIKIQTNSMNSGVYLITLHTSAGIYQQQIVVLQ